MEPGSECEKIPTGEEDGQCQSMEWRVGVQWKKRTAEPEMRRVGR
jgi:hypothetical protein